MRDDGRKGVLPAKVRTRYRACERIRSETRRAIHGVVAWIFARWSRALQSPVAGSWFATRIMYALLTPVILVLLDGPSTVGRSAPHALGLWPALAAYLRAWRFWDSAFFAAIAQRGYWQVALTAHFPLFPLAIHILSLPFGETATATTAMGYLLGNVGTLFGLWGVAHLIRCANGMEEVTAATVRWSLALLITWPFAFFLAAGYADGWVLAVIAWAMVWSLQGRLWRVGLLLELGALLHPLCSVALLPVMWIVIRQHAWVWQGLAMQWRTQRQIHRESFAIAGRTVLVILAFPVAYGVGIGLYALYCARTFGDPLAFAHQEHMSFGHTFAWPWQSLVLASQQVLAPHATSYLRVRPLLDFIPVLMVVLATCFAWRRLDAPARILVAVFLALVLCDPITRQQTPDAFTSAGRYVLAVLPLWIWAGRWVAEHPRIQPYVTYWCFMMTALQAILLAFVLRGGWLV